MSWKRYIPKSYDTIEKNNILSYVSDREIYSYYTNKRIRVNVALNSPLRNDKNPSFSFYYTNNGNIMWKDFSTNESGDVFKFVRILLKNREEKLYTYKEVINRIQQDIIYKRPEKVKLKIDPIVNNNNKKIIKISPKEWYIETLKYWAQYNIEKDLLEKFKVCPIKTFSVNGYVSPFMWSKDQPMYSYQVYNHYKIYRPLSKQPDKWRSNMTSYDIFGMEQLIKKGELLIITKSLKDVMILYKFGYNAIAPQTETGTIPKNIINDLKKRFKNIIVFYDNDKPGIRMSNIISNKYNFKKIYIPKEYIHKDISDLVKARGNTFSKQLLKKLINNALQEK